MRLSHKQPKVVTKKKEEFEPNVKYGIHTKPLPHFHKNNKKWWTAKKGYNASPKEVSQLKLMHKILMKNPSDALLFADKDSARVKAKNKEIKKKQGIPEKPNNLKKAMTKKVKTKSIQLRWTDGIIKHSGDALKIIEMKPQHEDLKPLFSSFHPKGIFKPPPSSKESLQRQKERTHREEKYGQGSNQSQVYEQEPSTDKKLTNERLFGTQNKTGMFKRVKTAYGKRSVDMFGDEIRSNQPVTKGSSKYLNFLSNFDLDIAVTKEKNAENQTKQESTNPWDQGEDQGENHQWTIRSSSRVGFRTSAFYAKQN